MLKPVKGTGLHLYCSRLALLRAEGLQPYCLEQWFTPSGSRDWRNKWETWAGDQRNGLKWQCRHTLNYLLNSILCSFITF